MRKWHFGASHRISLGHFPLANTADGLSPWIGNQLLLVQSWVFSHAPYLLIQE